MDNHIKLLRLFLKNTYLSNDVIGIIIKYCEPTIKVVLINTEDIYDLKEFIDLEKKYNIVSLDIYGHLTLVNPANMFEQSVLEDIKGYVSIVGDASNMFFCTRNFNGDLSKWDTSRVTKMNDMFYNNIHFNSDLSHWNTSNVTDMSNMFYNATNFTSDLSHWDTSKVTDMENMFYRARKFNSNLSDWDITNVTNMDNIFKDATTLNRKLKDWDYSKFKDVI